MDNLNNKLKISIDLMGGDSSPDKTLEGIDLFVKRYNSKDDYFLYLFGGIKMKHLQGYLIN